jgi:hypothetical protein
VSKRIRALHAAVNAYSNATEAAVALSEILDQIGTSSDELNEVLDEVGKITADLLLSAEQTRLAIHRFQEVADGVSYYGILKHNSRPSNN